MNQQNINKKLEEVIKKMAENQISNLPSLPKNFYGVEVDVYPSEYGKQAHITFIFKKPFSMKESDTLHDVSKIVKNFVKQMFGDIIKNVNSSNSTIESYENTKRWYEKKKLQESVKSKNIFKLKENKDIEFTKERLENLKKVIQRLIDSELESLREDSEDWGLGEMYELSILESVDKIEVVNIVPYLGIKVYIDIHVNTMKYDNYDYQDLRAEMQYRLEESFPNIQIFINDIIDSY